MRKNFKNLAVILTSVIASLAFASVGISNRPVILSVVNSSNQTVCIQDSNETQCLNTPSAKIQVTPQYFYERGGVIRISIGNSPLKIAMLKKNITEADIYVDAKGTLHVPDEVFEKGSFTYSDNKDYLYFVAKPNALFSAYPV
jgi:hypothetical protein